MDRRAFIVGTAGGLLAAGPTLAGTPDETDVRITTYVTNLSDHGGSTDVATGARLAVARVRDRVYDPLSIAVLGPDGRRLGFLPRSHGQVLAPLLDAGMAFEAVVSEAVPGRLGVELRLRGRMI